MIKDKTIDEALIEIMRTKKALEALRRARKAATETVTSGEKVKTYIRHSDCAIQHAAAERASMDLTRKLADLRASR